MGRSKKSESLDSLNLYFQKIKKIAVLTPEEEKELIAKAKAGDETSFKKVIVANQKLVVKEALKYYFKGDNFLDLINEGNKGLIEALKRFDPAMNNRFYTYAWWWVRSEIRRYLSKQQNIISFPDIFYNDYLNFKKQYFKLNRELKRKPTIVELSKKLNISEKKIKVMLAVPDEIVSLDKSVNDDSAPNLMTFIADDSKDPQEMLMLDSVNNLIIDDISSLTPKESAVIRMRFGFGNENPMKLREIAKNMGMSPEGVRRIEMKALRKLKAILMKQGVYGVLN